MAQTVEGAGGGAMQFTRQADRPDHYDEVQGPQVGAYVPQALGAYGDVVKIGRQAAGQEQNYSELLRPRRGLPRIGQRGGVVQYLSGALRHGARSLAFSRRACEPTWMGMYSCPCWFFAGKTRA